MLLPSVQQIHKSYVSANAALMCFSQDGCYLGPISGEKPASVTSRVGFNENATLPLEPGKTYRLHIVNTGAFAAFFFWIDGHDMHIIEADGVRIPLTSVLEAGQVLMIYRRLTLTSIPGPIDLLSVTVSQHYSVLVTARNDAGCNWAIHANMDMAMFDHVPDALQPSEFVDCSTR
jgi:iron transport multicopper oxidase